MDRLVREHYDLGRSLQEGARHKAEAVGESARTEGPTFDEWYASEKDRFDPDRVTTVAAGASLLPVPDSDSISISSECSQDNTWDTTIHGASPGIMSGQTAVWTGSLMILWPGGSRYDPITDSSTPISGLNAPSNRGAHTAIWTGAYMVIWGGYDGLQFLNTGGRYDPLSDAWLPTSTSNPPPGRSNHSAVWTGNRMIVYGGVREYQPSPGAPTAFVTLDTGGSYDPQGDTWTAIPSYGLNNHWGMADHAAVWTGSRMIVWGGQCLGYYPSLCSTPSGPNYIGGRYDPMAQTWTPISSLNAPRPQADNSAVWTGSLMLVWDEYGAGRYDPVGDSWTPVSTVNSPPYSAEASAVWTGSSMIVWGGYIYSSQTYLNTGGRYDPVADRWGLTSLVNAPFPRSEHLAVWTGSSMILGGGRGSTESFSDTARYLVDPNNPDADGDDVPLCAGDCDDTRPAVYPGAPQICDGVNDNCSDPAWPALPSPEPDVDGDGYFLCANDCNDGDPLIHPGAAERCNGLDDDCDTVVPANEADGDGDGYRICAGDCNDTQDSVHPGAPEVCNGIDDDCNGLPAVEADADHDGLATCAGDCDDTRAAVYPGAPQICDGINDNCSDPAWPALPSPEPDVDGDGYFLCANDCNDADVFIHPGAAERCNGLDDNCDTIVPSLENDADTDGYRGCSGDCDDTRSYVHPGAPEICDARDDDCDTVIPANETDADADGVPICQNDCDDSRADAWAPPGEVQAVTFTSATSANWQPPSSPGSTSIVYDVIRSSSQSNFMTGAACAYTNGISTSFSPVIAPPLGQAYFFLVRAENACPQGRGPVGNWSDGTPRTARTCP